MNTPVATTRITGMIVRENSSVAARSALRPAGPSTVKKLRNAKIEDDDAPPISHDQASNYCDPLLHR